MFNTVTHAVPTLHYSGEEETGAHSMFLWHSSSRERGVAGVAFHSTLIVNQSSTYSTAVTSHHRGAQSLRQCKHHMDSLSAVDTPPQNSRRSATFPSLIGTGEYSFLFWL